MAFNSFSFFLFVFMTAGIYFIVPGEKRWIVLLIASYIFYILSAGSLVILLAFTTLVAFVSAMLIEKSNTKYETAKKAENQPTSDLISQLTSINKHEKRFISAVALTTIFTFLGIMKYSNFFSENISVLLSSFSVQTNFPRINLLLPLGISFYTFQTAGYLIDVSRGKIKADRNLLKYALFVSYFPQIVQGPISRYGELAPQLYTAHDFDYTRIKFGAQLILWGLFKKMIIADRLAFPVTTIFDNYRILNGGFISFLGGALYSLQVYCDFSGGIDIARGVSQILGITLTENFRRPFFATSIEDFWRRWHITLSSWMRDYVFYPLSLSKASIWLGRASRKAFGKKIGKYIPTFTAQLITFTLVGIWHGPDWKFVAYGLYNGILICLGILIGPTINRNLITLKINTRKLSWRVFKIIGTFILVSFGRLFSRADSLSQALNMIKWTVLNFDPSVLSKGTIGKIGLDPKDFGVLSISLFILLAVGIIQEKGIHVRELISKQGIILRWSIYFFGIFFIIIFGIYGIDYVSNDFIYRGF
jgi:D-alanyl-lipoteichoic acid acyltransferase DltB (MBOAT superfamily)